MNHSIRANRRRAVPIPCAAPSMNCPHARACRTTLAERPTVGPNVRSVPNVYRSRRASMSAARTRVRVRAASVPSAVWSIIRRCASARLATRVIRSPCAIASQVRIRRVRRILCTDRFLSIVRRSQTVHRRIQICRFLFLCVV